MSDFSVVKILGTPTINLTPATASQVNIVDTGGYYVGTEVETALAEIGAGTTLDSRYINVSGDTMTGLLQFSGTTHAGLKLLSLTTTQRDALTPANGMIVYNSTDNQVQGYVGGTWGQIGGGGSQTPWTSDVNAAGYKLIGNTTTTGDLTLQTTSGVGTTGADMHFLVGNNGATEAMTILNAGNVGIGTTGPGARLGFAAATTAAGGIDFGGDVTLYRGAANELRTDDMIESVRASSTDNAFLTWVTGDSNNRWYVTADGTMRWGPGNASVDTNLYRGAANILQTDDGLNIAGNVGIGTTSPTNLLSLGGNSARIFWLERHTTANTAGNTLTVTAGGATSGATDKNGGDLLIQGGLSTGTGESGVKIYGCVAGATGTADRTQTIGIQVLGNKLGFYGLATPVIKPTGVAVTAEGIHAALVSLGLIAA